MVVEILTSRRGDVRGAQVFQDLGQAMFSGALVSNSITSADRGTLLTMWDTVAQQQVGRYEVALNGSWVKKRSSP